MSKDNLYDIYKKYNEIDMKLLKYNLKEACSKRYDTYGGREGLARHLGMELNKFQSCISPSHMGKLTFDNLIEFIGRLEIDEKELFIDQQIQKSNRGADKKWTQDRINDFVTDYKKGFDYIKEKYNLTEKTSMLYYNRFTEK